VLLLALGFVCRELWKSHKEKQAKNESKLSALEKTLNVTNGELMKLNLNFENFEKRIEKKIAQVDQNKKSLDMAHDSLRKQNRIITLLGKKVLDPKKS